MFYINSEGYLYFHIVEIGKVECFYSLEDGKCLYLYDNRIKLVKYWLEEGYVCWKNIFSFEITSLLPVKKFYYYGETFMYVANKKSYIVTPQKRKDKTTTFNISVVNNPAIMIQCGDNLILNNRYFYYDYKGRSVDKEIILSELHKYLFTRYSVAQVKTVTLSDEGEVEFSKVQTMMTCNFLIKDKKLYYMINVANRDGTKSTIYKYINKIVDPIAPRTACGGLLITCEKATYFCRKNEYYYGDLPNFKLVDKVKLY